MKGGLMYDNYNYPPGADTPDAPWNQPVIPDKEFEVSVQETLCRISEIVTDNYIPGYRDEEGYWEDDDTSDTDWEEEYKNQHHTILQLLAELKEMAEKELKTLPKTDYKRERKLKSIIEDCEGWELDDSEYEKA